MKVYALVAYWYEDAALFGVYSTADLAEAARAEVQPDVNASIVLVHEVEIDAAPRRRDDMPGRE